MENMDSFEAFFTDSQDPSTIDGAEIGFGIHACAPIDAMDENNNNTLKLNIEQRPPEHVFEAGGIAGDLSKSEADANLRRLVHLTEKINHRIAVVDARMATMETKSATSEGILLRVLQMTETHYDKHDKIIMVPSPSRGTPGNHSPHAKDQVVDQSQLVKTTELSTGVHKIGGIEVSTCVKSTTDKGKGLQMDSMHDRNLFDIVAPNSPIDDDDVQTDEIRSAQKKSSGGTHVVAASKVSPMWVAGTPKLSITGSSAKMALTTGPQDKAVFAGPLFSQFESTRQAAGLYRSTLMNPKSSKLPRLESVEITPMPSRPLLNLSRLPPTHPRGGVHRCPLVRQVAGSRNHKSSPNKESTLPAVSLECKLAAYIFQLKEDDPIRNLEEVLFELGEIEVVRGVFVSLAPPYNPHPDLINTAAMIASIRAARNMAPKIWYFPYNFAAAVLRDASSTNLQEYQGRWMPETNDLEHIFVPVWEPADTWYIILLDVKASKIYALDVCRSPESIMRREANMSKICGALGKMFMHSRNTVSFRHTNPDPTNWGDFIYPEGLPNDMKSAKTGVWCLSWLQHTGGFSTNIFRHMGNNGHRRMRAALDIVQSDINQHRGFVDAKAEVVWRSITDSN